MQGLILIIGTFFLLEQGVSAQPSQQQLLRQEQQAQQLQHQQPQGLIGKPPGVSDAAWAAHLRNQVRIAKLDEQLGLPPKKASMVKNTQAEGVSAEARAAQGKLARAGQMLANVNTKGKSDPTIAPTIADNSVVHNNSTKYMGATIDDWDPNKEFEFSKSDSYCDQIHHPCIVNGGFEINMIGTHQVDGLPYRWHGHPSNEIELIRSGVSQYGKIEAGDSGYYAMMKSPDVLMTTIAVGLTEHDIYTLTFQGACLNGADKGELLTVSIDGDFLLENIALPKGQFHTISLQFVAAGAEARIQFFTRTVM